MNMIKNAVLYFAITMLVACGGSSDTGSTGNSGGTSEADSSNDQPVQSDAEVGEEALVIEFFDAPLDPDVFNIAASEESLEQDFNPGEQIRTSWFLRVRNVDGSMINAGDSYLYDAEVYLSEDKIVDDGDLQLFSIECSFPETVDHACGQFASFITDYAPDNANVFRTKSIPLGKSLGLDNVEVDSTAFLNVIPKDVHLIGVACLREAPSVCDSFMIEISLL